MPEIPLEEIGYSLGFALVIHIYIALAVRTIAKKLTTPKRWLAWIPIANGWLLIHMAQKPWWWFLLMVFPIPILMVMTFLAPWPEGLATTLAVIAALSVFISYFVIGSLIWRRIVERLGKPGSWGVAMILLPPFGLFYLAILAWGKKIPA